MGQRYFVKSNGSDVLPITDGTLTTDAVSTDYETGVFVVAFYDASGDIVTPTAGTIKPEAMLIKGQWATPSSGDTTINAVDCIAGVMNYVVPVFNGPVEQGRLTFTGITGATSAKAYFWRV